jgi:hypothetical protein
MLAAHIDSLLFLLLLGAAGLMRLLAKRASGPSIEDENEAPPPSSMTQNPPPLPPQESSTDEERIRKFLEALGQPTSSRPPPPVRPRATPPDVSVTPDERVPEAARPARRRNVLNPLPPLTTAPAPLPPRRVTLPRQRTTPSFESKTLDPGSPIASTFEVQSNAPVLAAPPPLSNPVEVYAIATPSAASPGAKFDLVSLLKTPEALRQAIILREIFGPPRSLQPFDLAGNL